MSFRFLQRFFFRSSLFKNCNQLSMIKYEHPGNLNLNHEIQTNFLSTTNKTVKSRPEWQSILRRFAPIGICLFTVMQWRAYRKSTTGRIARQWEIDCYCLLPLRTVSRLWGYLADKKLPVFMRPIIYGLYANTFGVNVKEALYEDYKSYESLGDFFARPLKSGIREIDVESDLVSPCDGTILHFGTVHTGEIEQVKGVTYSLENFLGENTWNNKDNNNNYRNSLLHKLHENNTLYQCVIYLAPGDYHRFHSPADWKPTHRRHFHGQLLSVRPSIAKWLPGLFSLNERAVYVGSWKYGFFSYTAVGATNVGTIKVYLDKALHTNHSKKSRLPCKDVFLGNNNVLTKGDAVGEFRMGSTIVMVFEAPINFQFSVMAGDHLLMGQSLGHVGRRKFVDSVEKEAKNIKNPQ